MSPLSPAEQQQIVDTIFCGVHKNDTQLAALQQQLASWDMNRLLFTMTVLCGLLIEERFNRSTLTFDQVDRLTEQTQELYANWAAPHVLESIRPAIKFLLNQGPDPELTSEDLLAIMFLLSASLAFEDTVDSRALIVELVEAASDALTLA